MTVIKTQAIEVVCRWCGVHLDDEEAENPRRDADGDPICDVCWRGYCNFTCCWCQKYELIEHQHEMLVVAKPTPGLSGRRVIRGVYKIEQGPYYVAPLIGRGWLDDYNLTKIAPLPDRIDTHSYPCGHLCLDCQRKIMANAKAQKAPSAGNGKEKT